MDIDLPRPIATYVVAENSGDTEVLVQCFAEHAVVRDEGQTIEGLAAIKQWKAETRKKYQHTIEPLASIQKDGVRRWRSFPLIFATATFAIFAHPRG